MAGNLLASHVEGSPEAILATQTSFVHHFQRTNADYLEVDSTRTSLTGTGGTFRIGKFGGKLNKHGGIVKFETGVTWRSPELELNDAGFCKQQTRSITLPGLDISCSSRFRCLEMPVSIIITGPAGILVDNFVFRL